MRVYGQSRRRMSIEHRQRMNDEEKQKIMEIAFVCPLKSPRSNTLQLSRIERRTHKKRQTTEAMATTSPSNRREIKEHKSWFSAFSQQERLYAFQFICFIIVERRSKSITQAIQSFSFRGVRGCLCRCTVCTCTYSMCLAKGFSDHCSLNFEHLCCRAENIVRLSHDFASKCNLLEAWLSNWVGSIK